MAFALPGKAYYIFLYIHDFCSWYDAGVEQRYYRFHTSQIGMVRSVQDLSINLHVFCVIPKSLDFLHLCFQKDFRVIKAMLDVMKEALKDKSITHMVSCLNKNCYSICSFIIRLFNLIL